MCGIHGLRIACPCLSPKGNQDVAHRTFCDLVPAEIPRGCFLKFILVLLIESDERLAVSGISGETRKDFRVRVT